MRCEIVMPDIGAVNIHLSAWFADVGDEIFEGDRLIEVLVEGATFDVSAPVSGRLIEQQVLVGEPIGVGQVLGMIEGNEPISDAP
jgi:pyruvate/2-oxoglutarate dehydrogenase complex dihydrolipoamide acyltransferase (E2) component